MGHLAAGVAAGARVSTLSIGSTGRSLSVPLDVMSALEAAGLAAVFRTLPRPDQIQYGNWVESADPSARSDRVRSLVRIVYLWSKSQKRFS